MSKKLDAILACLDVIQKTYPEDTCIAVFDKEKIIAQLQGEKIKMPKSVGTRIADELQGSVTAKALQTGERIQEERDASLFGVPYVSTAVPVYEEGELVGCVSALTSQERLDVLRNGAAELSAVLEQMSATTDEIAQSSNHLSENIQELAGVAVSVASDIQQIYKVLDFVRNVATQSHLLGLNAAIEAARAGEAGRGFSVVAEEIRKMAEQSKKAVQDIQQQLDHVVNAVDRINQSIQSMSGMTQEHAANIEELNSAFAHIAATAEKLANAATN
jgi:archaellum component FlaC